MNIKKANVKKIDINQIISVITLNINRIRAPIKRQILSICITTTRTTKPKHYAAYKIHALIWGDDWKSSITERWKVKHGKTKNYYIYINIKQSKL